MASPSSKDPGIFLNCEWEGSVYRLVQHQLILILFPLTLVKKRTRWRAFQIQGEIALSETLRRSTRSCFRVLLDRLGKCVPDSRNHVSNYWEVPAMNWSAIPRARQNGIPVTYLRPLSTNVITGYHLVRGIRRDQVRVVEGTQVIIVTGYTCDRNKNKKLNLAKCATLIWVPCYLDASYPKILRWKVVRHRIPYKKVSGRICLSYSGVELGCSKDCHLWNILT